MINLFNIEDYKINTNKFCHLLHDEVVNEFEQDFAEYVGAGYACSANSASSLITLALWNKKQIVTIPSLIPTVVPNAIIRSGNQLNWRDDTIWVGNMYKLHSFEGYSIYDSAQQVERDIFKKVNPQDLMIFSFYPTKPVGSCDGGMIVSDDREKIEWFRKAVMGGATASDNSWDRDLIFPGWKMNMNSIQAYIAQQNLQKLDNKNERIAEIRSVYNKAFHRDNKSSHLFRINVKDRNKFIDKMRAKKICCGVHYKACHLNPVYNAYKADRQSYVKKSKKDSKTTVSIPLHEKLTDEDLEYIIGKIHKARRVLKAVR
tara:strand:- start:11149 stop:12096 length:948 start_codon:yes stop_codon:yes gene_type:complete